MTELDDTQSWYGAIAQIGTPHLCRTFTTAVMGTHTKIEKSLGATMEYFEIGSRVRFGSIVPVLLGAISCAAVARCFSVIAEMWRHRRR